MGRFAFVVAYTDNYLKGVTALVNSIKKHAPHLGIIKYNGNSIEDTAIRRFRIACDVVSDYDAICLMDADMFLTADPTLFFDVASKGFIVTGSNGMVIDFDKKHQEKYQCNLGMDHCVYSKVHTTAPIFLNAENIDWFKIFLENRKHDFWDDFLYLNMIGIKFGKQMKMICLPPYTFTGIHHWQMKPATALFRRGEMFLTGTEEQVYMIHGKWWDQGWLQDLMPTMERYLKDENIGEKGKWRTENAIKLIKEEFNKLIGGEK